MSNHSGSEDRRRFSRIECLKAGRVITIVDNAGTLHISAALTKNVCAGGLFFKDPKRYSVDAMVLIEIEPGVLDANELAGAIKTFGYVLGTIVRVEQSYDGQAFDHGVRFVTVHEGDQYLPLFQTLLNCVEYRHCEDNGDVQQGGGNV